MGNISCVFVGVFLAQKLKEKLNPTFSCGRQKAIPRPKVRDFRLREMGAAIHLSTKRQVSGTFLLEEVEKKMAVWLKDIAKNVW